MASTPGLTTPYHSVRQALRVLEAVADSQPDGIHEDELAHRTHLPPAQLAHLLTMLRREGYVRQLPDGACLAGDSLRALGSGGSDERHRVRREKLQEALDGLRESVGAAVYLAQYHDGELHVLYHSEAADAPAVNQWVDFRYAAHATAIGKCLLGQLDHGERQEHLTRHKTARLTSRTITDHRTLLSALERQPASVPVLDLQEYAVGTLCAAVPLTAGATVGCLALSLPVERAHRLRRAAETLNTRAAPALLTMAL